MRQAELTRQEMSRRPMKKEHKDIKKWVDQHNHNIEYDRKRWANYRRECLEHKKRMDITMGIATAAAMEQRGKEAEAQQLMKIYEPQLLQMVAETHGRGVERRRTRDEMVDEETDSAEEMRQAKRNKGKEKVVASKDKSKKRMRGSTTDLPDLRDLAPWTEEEELEQARWVTANSRCDMRNVEGGSRPQTYLDEEERRKRKRVEEKACRKELEIVRKYREAEKKRLEEHHRQPAELTRQEQLRTKNIDVSAETHPQRAIDLVAAVKGLHELSPQQLNKLIRDSGNNVVCHTAEDGSQIQVDMENFARYLPLHLIAVIIAWERDKSTFKYLLCGILLLQFLCDVTSRAPKIEQILFDDVKVSEQQLDLVFYLLVLLGGFKREIHDIPNDMVPLHSALVACSLKLLVVIVSPQYEEVTQVLVAYHKVDIFMDSTFSAVSIDVKFLHTMVSADQTESSVDTTLSPEETLTHLFQQCDYSLHFVQSLCQQKMFRECIVKNKELCTDGGILVLVRAVMNLKLSHIHSTSASSVASVSRLKTKALSILLYICETESLSYLDEIASNTRSQNLSKSIVLQSEALAAMFLCPHGDFVSGWCSSDLPVCEDDATLDVPRAAYAHQRTSLLIKMIANLHCHAPDVCQDEKDLFLHEFVRFIQNESRKQSNGCPSNPVAEKFATAGKNLGSLLSHAESLVPRFLNEDDVQLLRLFINQYDTLIVRVGSEYLVQHAQTTEACSSSLHKELAQNYGNNGISINESTQDAASLEANQLDDSRNMNNQSLDGERKPGTVELGKYNGSTAYLREIEREAQTVETSGSDSSPTQGKNLVDQLDGDQVRGSVFEDMLDDEKVDAIHSDEKQQRIRKRTVMNDKQIELIESALVDEPDMHRNAAALRSWADKLSLHGAEVSTSRLKNWLNNRKARLARAANDVRASYDGESLDRQGCSGQLDSAQSPVDDTWVSSAARESLRSDDTALTSNTDADTGTTLPAPRDIVRSGPFFEPGQ